MNDELYGVFFRDLGVQEYLLFVHEDEWTAIEEADRRSKEAFEDALERHDEEMAEAEGMGEASPPEPEWEDFDGMFYVELITRELAEEAQEPLARNMAVPVN